MVYGSLEHVLWDALASGKTVDIEHTSDALAHTILSGIFVPSHAPAAEDRLHARMNSLMKRMETMLGADETGS